MGKRNNWQDFQLILEQHQIKKLYHFTDRENLQSIINNGGLYSWADSEEKGITIAKPGGGNPSRKLDKKHGLEHYVRLSFTKRHPMMFVAKNDGRINDPVILEINPEILYEEDTLFSDKNAASNDAHVGGTLDDFKKIHFKSVTASKHFDLEESEQPYFQAEILVKNFVPLSYITNIESFGILIKQPVLDEETLTTEVTKKDLDNGVKDEFGAIYSSDGKRLLKGPDIQSYQIKPGTQVICDEAFVNINKKNNFIAIGMFAYYCCTGLNSITIPDSVTKIGSRAFLGCSGLDSIDIPSSVTSIGYSAFYCCTALNQITIPNSVTFVGGLAFEKTAWLNKQPDGLIYIGQAAYKYKGKMTEATFITLKDSTTCISSAAFRDCGCLVGITIPNSVVSIESETFERCEKLAFVNIPSSVITIGYHAFYSCKGLASIVIPDSVTSLGTGAFEFCYSLARITFPKSVVSIGENAFDNTAWFNNQPDGPVYISQMLYKYKGIMPNNTSITIRESILGIVDSAFKDCSKLLSISIPNSVISIGQSAFKDCSRLASIIIPNSVTSIGHSAFSGCSSLTKVTIPNSVTSICGNAFYGCKGLTSIEIPDSVKSIGYSAFNGCCNLTQITIPNSVTSIGHSAFSGCSSLTNVTIPNSVTSIGNSAFYGCKGLTRIIIPNSIKIIEDDAFSNCGLSKIIIPASVTSIGRHIFYKCKNLTYIKVEDGNPVFDSRNNCNAIVETSSNTIIVGCKNTTFPDSITSIGKEAFSGCCGLISTIIPNSVTSIDYAAFSYCSDLTSIVIPLSVTKMGVDVFNFCPKLNEIYIPKGSRDKLLAFLGSEFSEKLVEVNGL